MYNAKAYAAASEKSPLASTTIARRDPTPNDVQMEILFCGICHSDLHQVRNEWSGVMPTVYPCVPGHEIVGRVTKIGSGVTKFKVGDIGAVGCMVDSDGTCAECKEGMEQFCPNFVLTYNFPDKHTGGVTYGGYSDSIVWIRSLCSRFRGAWIWRGLRLCCARESRRSRHCTTGELAKARRLGSLDWADWGTWA